jgi:hypothetical protein
MVYEWYLMYRVFHNPEKHHEFMLVIPEVTSTSALISRWCMFECALLSNSVNIPLHCHLCRNYVGFNSFIWWTLVNIFSVEMQAFIFVVSRMSNFEHRVIILTDISCPDMCFLVNGNWVSCGWCTKYLFWHQLCYFKQDFSLFWLNCVRQINVFHVIVVTLGVGAEESKICLTQLSFQLRYNHVQPNGQ